MRKTTGETPVLPPGGVPRAKGIARPALFDKLVNMPKYIASIDQGTTSTRCMLFDRSGPVLSAQKEHAQIFPRPGWVEHDPMEIWHRTQEVVRDVRSTAGIRRGDIAAIGIANQRE